MRGEFVSMGSAHQVGAVDSPYLGHGLVCYVAGISKVRHPVVRVVITVVMIDWGGRVATRPYVSLKDC